jgi:hypothetical protein
MQVLGSQFLRFPQHLTLGSSQVAEQRHRAKACHFDEGSLKFAQKRGCEFYRCPASSIFGKPKIEGERVGKK